MKRDPPCKEKLHGQSIGMFVTPDKSRSPSFEGVSQAYEKVKAVLPPTPLLPLNVGGATIWCKAESEQPMGAFKLRGAWHRLTDLSDAERGAGVVAFSSGNHAQGVAWAAGKLGIAAAIVMPSNAPGVKVENTRALGAEVIFYDRMTEDRIAIAHALAAERGATIVPPFDDPWIIEGQGSAGLEAREQMGEAFDLVVCPCGGGGLTAGVALANPEARVAFAEPEGWDDMIRSLEAGELRDVGPNPPSTPCDALQTLMPSPLTFAVLRDRGAHGVSVSPAEVGTAMRLAKEDLGLTVEPGGAAALAAILAGKIAPGARTLVILSGGNVDPEVFSGMTGLEAAA